MRTDFNLDRVRCRKPRRSRRPDFLKSEPRRINLPTTAIRFVPYVQAHRRRELRSPKSRSLRRPDRARLAADWARHRHRSFGHCARETAIAIRQLCYGDRRFWFPSWAGADANRCRGSERFRLELWPAVAPGRMRFRDVVVRVGPPQRGASLCQKRSPARSRRFRRRLVREIAAALGRQRRSPS